MTTLTLEQTTRSGHQVRASSLRGGDTLLADGQRVRIAAVYNTGEHTLLYPVGMPGAEWSLPHDELVAVA